MAQKKKLVTRTVTGRQTKGNDWRTAQQETGSQRQARNTKAKAKAKTRR